MIRIGEVQDLQIVKRTDFGVYVGDEQERCFCRESRCLRTPG